MAVVPRRSRDELVDLLAFMAGSAVNAVQAKADRPDIARLAHGDALALRFDMTEWFQPTAENYSGASPRA